MLINARLPEREAVEGSILKGNNLKTIVKKYDLTKGMIFRSVSIVNIIFGDEITIF